MADLLRAVFEAGERVVKAQAEEAEAHRLFDENPSGELLERCYASRVEVDRLLIEQKELMGKLWRGAAAGEGA